jgi:ABC-type nitrate/sulfonate/bicarbonate transport system substrate-binding protein
MKARLSCFLLTAVLTLVLVDATAAEEVNISYPGLTGESSPLWVAKESHTFDENGLNVNLIYMEGGRLSIQSLLSGTTQFMGGDAVSALTAVAGGVDIVLLASPKNILPYVFAVSPDIKRPQDLKNKTIAVSQIGGRAGEIARMVVKNMGLDPDKDVKYLSVGGSRSRLAALSKGTVQAAPVARGLVPTVEKAGLKTLEVKPIPFIVDALWTTREYAKTHPEIVDRVVKSLVKGVAITVRDRDMAIRTLRKYTKIDDPKVLNYTYDTYVQGIDRIPIPSNAAIENTIEMSLRLAPKLSDIDVKKHFYFEPVNELKKQGYIEKLYK